MDINQLQYLYEVYEKNSYAKAAEELNKTPSALTIAVKKLEDELGLRLFSRNGRSILPTSACDFLMPSVVLTLNDIQQLRDTAAECLTAK